MVHVWDYPSGRLRYALTGHRGLVLGVAFAPAGRRLVTVGDDHAVRLWDLPPPGEGVVMVSPRLTLADHGCTVKAVAFAPDGGAFATAGADGRILVWPDIPAEAGLLSGGALAALAGRPREVHDAKSGAVACLAWSKRGLASGDAKGNVRLWHADDGGEPGRVLFRLPGMALALAWSPDGTNLAAGVNSPPSRPSACGTPTPARSRSCSAATPTRRSRSPSGRAAGNWPAAPRTAPSASGKWRPVRSARSSGRRRRTTPRRRRTSGPWPSPKRGTPSCPATWPA